MYRNQNALRIRFDKPGFFINDPRVEVDFDGVRIYEGSFMSGFDRTVTTSAGHHELVTRITVGPVMRPKRWTFELDEAPRFTITLRYSRFWGNFTRKLDLTRA